MRTIPNWGGEALSLSSVFVFFLLALSAPAHASVNVNPAAINFGTVAVGMKSVATSVTLTNTGWRSVQFVSATVSSTQFSYVGPTQIYLRPSQSVQVSISFTPTAAQSDSGTLTFTRASGFTITISLAGTGVATTTQAPSITSQPVNQTVTSGQTASFSVGVSGAAPFTYQWKKNGVSISGATSSQYTTPATTTSDNGAQFTVIVTNSAGSATSSAATLTVNAASTPLLTISPASLSFGNVNLGANSGKSATVTNSGSTSITISSVSYSGAGFTVSGLSSGLVLSPGQAATLSVTFAPTSAGSVTGAITVNSNASNSPGSVSISGTGVQLISHSANLSWVPSTSTVAGYYVYRGTLSGGPYSKLTSTADILTSYADSTVQSGQTYYYVVTSVNSSSVESAYSNETSAAIP